MASRLFRSVAYSLTGGKTVFDAAGSSSRTLCTRCAPALTATRPTRPYSTSDTRLRGGPAHFRRRMGGEGGLSGLRDGRRIYSSAAEAINYQISTLNPQQYHAIADATLETLQDGLEALIEDTDAAGSSEWDIESASGVMNVRLGSNGTYVINKQPPNNQIWLSSPTSGPLRFDYSLDHQTWFSTKPGRKTVTLGQILRQELGILVGQKAADAAVPEDLQ